MTSLSQALRPAMAAARGVGGPGHELAAGPAASPKVTRCWTMAPLRGVRTISGSGGVDPSARARMSAPARSWLPWAT